MKISARWLVVPALLGLLVMVDRPRALKPIHQAEWLVAGDATLRTIRAGTGDTTLLLIHGFGESLFTWRAVFDDLAKRRRVIAVDLPGFGGSSKPVGSYSLDSMTSRLTQFIDRWTTGPIVILGHSMGGEIGASAALARPDRIVATILIAPAGWAVGLGGLADTMYPTKARAIGWYLSSRAFILPEHDPEWLGEPDSAATYTLVGDTAYQAATAKVLEEFEFTGLRGRFGLLTQPTLLLWGTRDPVIPVSLADTLVRTLPCATLITFPGAFHRPQAEIPDQVTAAVERFLAKPSC